MLFLTLLALKHRDKGGVVKQLWWKFWLLGFAADAIGVAWMLLGWLLAVPFGSWWESSGGHIMHNAFAHPAAFLWTLVGVALAGVRIYCFDKKAMGGCDLLAPREKHTIALVMTVVTARWLFFIPMY